MSSLSNNTVSQLPTHFLRAVEMINSAWDPYRLANENWAYPTRYRMGSPRDEFYAEVWVNGMDSQNNYWVLFKEDLEGPHCEPLISFDHHRYEERFPSKGDFIEAMLSFRRDQAVAKRLKIDPPGGANSREPHISVATMQAWDEVWCFSWTNTDPLKHVCMVRAGMCHASQPPVEFLANKGFLPEALFSRRRPSSAVEPINYRKVMTDILKKDEVVPLLMGISPELDRAIEKKLKKSIPLQNVE